MNMHFPIFGITIALVGSVFHFPATASENSVAVSKGSQLQGCWRRSEDLDRETIIVQLCFRADMSMGFAYLAKYDGWSHGGSYSVVRDRLNMIEIESIETTHNCVFETAGNSLSMRNCAHEGEYKKYG